MEEEIRKCNICGEEWTDNGEVICPFCGSDDTYIIDELDDEPPARVTCPDCGADIPSDGNCESRPEA
jgi:hypothetical protein